MKKQVAITITGTQLYSLAGKSRYLDGAHPYFTPVGDMDEGLQTVELCTSGTMSCDRSGKISLSYDESEITGLEGSRTTFTLENELVTLSRTGGASDALLIFENGKRHQMYTKIKEAPPVCVDCHSMQYDLSPRGGAIDVDYSVEVAGTALERNTYRIRVDL